jgi:hypothetical protein
MEDKYQLATQQAEELAKVEKVLVAGDLAVLTPAERVIFVKRVCDSLGLNYMTKPFEFISFQGKMMLYARKDATEQLRKIHAVSIDDVQISETKDEIIVTVKGHDKAGKTDSDIGVVVKPKDLADMPNARMKAVTKAKRRFTLSICGLGWLDESELDGIKNYRVHNFDPNSGNFVDGRVVTDPLPAEIERLLNDYGPDAVMAACGGILPDSMAKCAEIEATIAQAISIEAAQE